jgi:hypothetical protein
MILLDRMLVGSIKFVLGKLAAAVDAELAGLSNDAHLREELLAAQMQLELGELGEEEFAGLERELLARLREVRKRKLGEDASAGELEVTGAVASTYDGKE